MPADSAERKVKDRALVERALGPDLSTVAVDDPLNDGEPHPSAWKLARGVQPLENAEEPVGILRVEPRTVVADVIDGFVALAERAAKLDTSLDAFRGVLPGIGEEILQRNAQ